MQFGAVVKAKLLISYKFLLICATVFLHIYNVVIWSWFLLSKSIIFVLLIEASLKNLLSTERNVELIEGIVSSLIMHLIRRMCSPFKVDGK